MNAKIDLFKYIKVCKEDIRKSEHFSILLFWLRLESKACFVEIK